MPFRRILAVIIFLVFMIAAAYAGGSAVAFRDDGNTPGMSLEGKRKIGILMYHKINSSPLSGGLGLRVPVSDFDWQLRYLKRNGFHVVSLEQVDAYLNDGKPLPPKPVVLTFDDGYRDNYLNAFPLLQKYNCPATVFVVTSYVGGSNEWDRGKNTENKLMSWDEIQEMARAGIGFGSHTVTHPRMAEVPEAEVRKQLADSKKKLEEKLGQPVLYFCYPYGNVNQSVANSVQQEGYRLAVTTRVGYVSNGDNRFELNRVRVTGHTGRDGFRRLIREVH